MLFALIIKSKTLTGEKKQNKTKYYPLISILTVFFTLTKPSLSNRRQVGTKTFSVMVIYCETKDVMFSLVHRQCVKRKHCMTALHFIMTNKSEESFLSPLMGKPDESSFSFAQQIRSDRYINRGGTTL